MISKTLGQLTQDETRLWEYTFCSIWKGVEYRSKAADDAIAALRQYRAESEAKPEPGPDPRGDMRVLVRVSGDEFNGTGVLVDPRDPPREGAPVALGTTALPDGSSVVFWTGAPSEEQMTAAHTGSGIIGTYDPLNKGWWLNGPTIPRFEPDPRFERNPEQPPEVEGERR